MKEKVLKANDKYFKLNMLIRDATIRGGDVDNLGPIDIYYKNIGKYVLALIEDCMGKCWYRIFVSPGVFHYERNRIFSPVEGEEDLLYVYGYYDNVAGTERELHKLHAGEWMEQLQAVVEEELYEN